MAPYPPFNAKPRKFENVFPEYAVMAALRQLNKPPSCAHRGFGVQDVGSNLASLLQRQGSVFEG